MFSTDHGELQSDFGLLFKGPYHVDGLMRLPLIWRPAPSAGLGPAVVTAPVGLVDLAPTFCSMAGLDVPEWMQGASPPLGNADARARGFERVITEWDSELFGVDMHLRTITRDGWICTAYGPGFVHYGTEGELYCIEDDPLQRENLWDDPAHRSVRDDLVADLRDHQAPPASPGSRSRRRCERQPRRRARVLAEPPARRADSSSASGRQGLRLGVWRADRSSNPNPVSTDDSMKRWDRRT